MSATLKAAGFIYWAGITAPLPMVIALKVIEHFRIKPGIGIPGIALVSLAICVAGVCSGNTNTRQRIAMFLLAVCAIPVELLLLGFLFILSGGLNGTQ